MEFSHIGDVVHTGLQTLALMAIGWAIAQWQLLKPAVTNTSQAISLINMLVMRVCLPALQLLLISVHTDMRNMQNWKTLGAFMLWTAVIQAGCGLWCIVMEDGKLDQWGLHALVLAANNTGILAPVVLDAALGPGSGYIGMLATVCLYFQQLPISEALMAAGKTRNSQQASPPCHSHSCDIDTPQTYPEQHSNHPGPVFHESLELQDGVGHHSAVDSIAQYQAIGQGLAAAWQARHKTQYGSEDRHVDHKVTKEATQKAAGPQQSSLFQLLVQNPLMWTTGVAALLSAAGSPDMLSPTSKHYVKQFAFIAGSLDWLARCSVPLTLLSTGLWLHGRFTQLGGKNMKMVVVYLLLKLFVLPWLMVAITYMMGISGKHGLALLLLTVVPVGQTAFVISERQACGTGPVTATLIAGLLLMLPHLLAVLWIVNALGIFNGIDTDFSWLVNNNVNNSGIITANVSQQAVPSNKKTRRRGPDKAQQIKTLEARLTQMENQAAAILHNNVMLQVRAEVLKLVLEVRDRQSERLRSLQTDETLPIPIRPYASSIEEFEKICTPQWFGGQFARMGSELAMQLEPLMPLIQKHPQLITPRTPFQHPSYRKQALPDVSLTSHEIQLLQELEESVQQYHALAAYACFIQQKLLLGVSSNVELVSAHSDDWESICKKVSSCSLEDTTSSSSMQSLLQGSIPSSAVAGSIADVATEEHWAKVIRETRLTDLQSVQCLVLWELLAHARTRATTQRASLAAAITAIQQAPKYSNSTQSNPQATYMPSEGAACIGKTDQQLTQEAHLLSQLQAVLEKEKAMLFLVGEVLFEYIISSVQCALLCITSYPYLPDTTALLYAAAKECTDQVVARLADKTET